MGRSDSVLGFDRTTGTEVQIQNMFEPLEESEEDEEMPNSLIDSDSEEEEESQRDKAEIDDSESSGDEDLMELLKQSVGQVWKVVRSKKKRNSRRRSKEWCAKDQRSCGCCKTESVSQEQESVGTLIEMTADQVNGLNHQVEEWEEIEFLVDSGAPVTVVGDEAVRAVQAESPNRERQYKLADGSFIPQRGL